MRLTINLEEEHYLIAKSLAKEADCSISVAVNDLIRRALEPDTHRSSNSSPALRNGFRTVHGKKPISSKDVENIEFELTRRNEGTTS